jgi:uncharacterized protein YukE
MANKTDERYDHAALKEMAKAFQQASETLKQTMNVAKQISQMMQSGALEGDTGDEFRNGIDTTLTKKLNNLDAKMLDMKKDIENAIRENEAAVRDSREKYN